MFAYFIVFVVGFIIGFISTYLEYKSVSKTIDVVDARFSYSLNYLESLIRKVEGIKNKEVKNIEAGAKNDVASVKTDVSQEADKVATEVKTETK
jgi:hypothetical protein